MLETTFLFTWHKYHRFVWVGIGEKFNHRGDYRKNIMKKFTQLV